MHTNETRGLWPTLPNGLGYEFNGSGTKEKKAHFLALSAALPVQSGCQGIVSEPRALWPARFRQAREPAAVRRSDSESGRKMALWFRESRAPKAEPLLHSSGRCQTEDQDAAVPQRHR